MPKNTISHSHPFLPPNPPQILRVLWIPAEDVLLTWRHRVSNGSIELRYIFALKSTNEYSANEAAVRRTIRREDDKIDVAYLDSTLDIDKVSHVLIVHHGPRANRLKWSSKG